MSADAAGNIVMGDSSSTSTLHTSPGKVRKHQKRAAEKAQIVQDQAALAEALRKAKLLRQRVQQAEAAAWSAENAREQAEARVGILSPLFGWLLIRPRCNNSVTVPTLMKEL